MLCGNQSRVFVRMRIENVLFFTKYSYVVTVLSEKKLQHVEKTTLVVYIKNLNVKCEEILYKELERKM